MYVKRPFNELICNISGSPAYRAQIFLGKTHQDVQFAICKSMFIFLLLAMSSCTIRPTTISKEMTR